MRTSALVALLIASVAAPALAEDEWAPGATGAAVVEDEPVLDERIEELELRIEELEAERAAPAAPASGPSWARNVRLGGNSNAGYYGGRGWTMSVPETRVTEYEQGTFVIDIADAREKELVWRGIARGRVSKTPPGPAEQREQFFQVASEILVEFPPR